MRAARVVEGAPGSLRAQMDEARKKSRRLLAQGRHEESERAENEAERLMVLVLGTEGQPQNHGSENMRVMHWIRETARQPMRYRTACRLSVPRERGDYAYSLAQVLERVTCKDCIACAAEAFEPTAEPTMPQ